MLPLQAREDIRQALLGVYRIPAPHPDPAVQGFSVRPHIRWRYQDFDRPDPPYDALVLSLDPTGVIESDQPVDGIVEEVERTAEADTDADHADIRGHRVHDDLNIQVNSVGSKTINGESYSEGERAGGLAREVRRFLLYQYNTRPLDYFDAGGNQTTAEDFPHGEDLRPPVHARPISGRGATDVTGRVDATGSQWDTAVRLHYVDSFVEFQYTPGEATITTIRID